MTSEASSSSAFTWQREFYLEHPDVAALTPAEVAKLRESLGIRVHGTAAAPNLVSTFVQASFPQYLLDALRDAGYRSPTPIQRQAWPMAMNGADFIGLAETGSGKTLAFLLPAVVHVNAQPVLADGEGPIALVLAPTRELAAQIHDEAVKFGQCVLSACVYGGVPKQPQVEALRKGPELLVATPGRLADLVTARRTTLGRATLLIVDEADRLLDMGFEPQLRALERQMRPRGERQTLLFSATWPDEVRFLAEAFVGRGAPIVEVGGALSEAGTANAAIEQKVVWCEAAAKTRELIALLERLMDGSRILVFAASKKRCDELTRELRLDGWPALAIHGDKSQEEREWVLTQFKDGEQPLLIATDVAQRGLDIKDVRAVVNYDAPTTGTAYVHRIGRTGRAGASGTAYTFVNNDDRAVARDLVRVLKDAKQDVPARLQTLANEARADAWSRGRS